MLLGVLVIFFADGRDGVVVAAALLLDNSVIIRQNFNNRKEKDSKVIYHVGKGLGIVIVDTCFRFRCFSFCNTPQLCRLYLT